jgi:hypothetical protein
MKIEIERSGGFAGIKKVIAVDTENLPREIASRIETFFSKTKSSEGTPRAAMKKDHVADCYYYKILTVRENKKQQFVFNEFDIDKELKLAINFILKNIDTRTNL